MLATFFRLLSAGSFIVSSILGTFKWQVFIHRYVSSARNTSKGDVFFLYFVFKCKSRKWESNYQFLNVTDGYWVTVTLLFSQNEAFFSYHVNQMRIIQWCWNDIVWATIWYETCMLHSQAQQVRKSGPHIPTRKKKKVECPPQVSSQAIGNFAYFIIFQV